MNGRLLILDQFSQPGGAQRCLLDLLPAFIDAGYETHVAFPGDGAVAETARRCGAQVYRIPCGPYSSGQKNWADTIRFVLDLPRQISHIASLVLKHGIDVIYVNGPRLMPAVAMAACGRPVVFHAHSVVTQQGAARLARWAIRSINAYVIAASRFVLEPLESILRDRGSQVIYNGTPSVKCALESYRNRRRDDRPWRVGVIGRIAPEKGQLEFVRAVRVVLERQRCEFVVCGDALFSSPEYGSRVRAAAEGLPIDFIGWRDDIREVLLNLDVLVVPSAPVDSTPRVIIEAFSAGVPVVAFRAGGIPEIIADGVTGLLCSPTPQALASTLLDLFSDRRCALDALAARAHASFVDRFSLERYRSEVLAVVRHAITQSNVKR